MPIAIKEVPLEGSLVEKKWLSTAMSAAYSLSPENLRRVNALTLKLRVKANLLRKAGRLNDNEYRADLFVFTDRGWSWKTWDYKDIGVGLLFEGFVYIYTNQEIKNLEEAVERSLLGLQIGNRRILEKVKREGYFSVYKWSDGRGGGGPATSKRFRGGHDTDPRCEAYWVGEYTPKSDLLTREEVKQIRNKLGKENFARTSIIEVNEKTKLGLGDGEWSRYCVDV